MSHPLYVFFLWHFHQPLYRDPDDGAKLFLPWVRLHSLRSYPQVAEIAARSAFPCCVNLVPSLLEQISLYASGGAVDPMTEIFGAREIGQRERTILAEFCPWLDPSRHADAMSVKGEILRAWISPLLLKDAFGGKRPSSEELMALQDEILTGLPARLRAMVGGGVVEGTTTPYHHPLMPLVADSHLPHGVPLPKNRYRHPEDVALHLARGRSAYREFTGVDASGIWPSEGAVSPEVADLIGGAGFSWVATDASVLASSLKRYLGPAELFRPWRHQGLTFYFRDTELSNLLSFTYTGEDPRAEAEDFVMRLRYRREALAGPGVCTVILDGENPWEHYKENGVEFLETLFDAIRREPGIVPSTPSTISAGAVPEPEEFDLAPGTWMGDFGRWIGKEAKNRAWDLLYDAREACGGNPEAYESLLVAEASDWFWWYGDEDVPSFDHLFRRWLARAYREASLPVPPAVSGE
jgi:alpha-amylase/alpha-mannosidase (GH57 family)